MFEYEEAYRSIVEIPPADDYKSAEDEAAKIKKFTLLKDEDVHYEETNYSSSAVNRLKII